MDLHLNKLETLDDLSKDVITQGCFVRSLLDIGPVVKIAMYIHNVATISPCKWVFSVNFTWMLCANSSLVEIQGALVLWKKIRM